jgi:hypothetical protein
MLTSGFDISSFPRINRRRVALLVEHVDRRGAHRLGFTKMMFEGEQVNPNWFTKGTPGCALESLTLGRDRGNRKAKTPRLRGLLFEVPPRFELGNGGFADHCLTTWLWHRTEGTVLARTLAPTPTHETSSHRDRTGSFS